MYESMTKHVWINGNRSFKIMLPLHCELNSINKCLKKIKINETKMWAASRTQLDRNKFYFEGVGNKVLRFSRRTYMVMKVNSINIC